MKMNNQQILLDGATVRRLLIYDSKTGVFTRRVDGYNNTTLMGDVAGCLDKTTGYWRVGIGGRVEYAHRLACLYVTDTVPEQVDHRDLDKLNNSWDNLLMTTHAANTKRKKRLSTNTSKLTGVSWQKNISKWYVYIGIDGKRKNLGYERDFFDACCIRKSANNKYGYGDNHGNT